MEILPEKIIKGLSLLQINLLFKYNFNNFNRIILEIENEGRQYIISKNKWLKTAQLEQ